MIEEIFGNSNPGPDPKQNIIEMGLSDYVDRIKQDESLYKTLVKVQGIVEDVRYQVDTEDIFLGALISMITGFLTIPRIKTLYVNLANGKVNHTFKRVDAVILPWEMKKRNEKRDLYNDLIKQGQELTVVVKSDDAGSGLGGGFRSWLEGVEQKGKMYWL